MGFKRIWLTVKFALCGECHKSSDGKFSHISAVLFRFTYFPNPKWSHLFPRACSLPKWEGEKTFSVLYHLPKWKRRRPDSTFLSAPFWLTFFSCDLCLLATRIAAVDFSRVALAGLPGLEQTPVQPVVWEEGAWGSGCSHGLRNWVEGAGQWGEHERPTWGKPLNASADRSNYISFSSTWNQTLMVSIPNLFYILLNKVKPHSKTSKWYNTVVFSHRNKKFTWNSLTLLQDFVLWGKKLGRNYCIIGFWLGLKSMKISLFNIKTFHRK